MWIQARLNKIKKTGSSTQWILGYAGLRRIQRLLHCVWRSRTHGTAFATPQRQSWFTNSPSRGWGRWIGMQLLSKVFDDHIQPLLHQFNSLDQAFFLGSKTVLILALIRERMGCFRYICQAIMCVYHWVYNNNNWLWILRLTCWLGSCSSQGRLQSCQCAWTCPWTSRPDSVRAPGTFHPSSAPAHPPYGECKGT